MYKISLISILVMMGLAYNQSSLAHNEIKTFEDSNARRLAAEEKQKRDSWDSFMKEVKSQEKEQDMDKPPVETDEHHDYRY